MPKKLLSAMLMLALVFSSLAVSPNFNLTASADDDLWSGDTTEVNPDDDGVYYIGTPQELAWVATKVNGGNSFSGVTIKLKADINLSGHDWVPIGHSDSKPFKGNFDGQGYTISNMHIGSKAENGDIVYSNYTYTGLFGRVQADSGKTVTIQNVNIGAGSYIYSSGGKVGGICAYAYAYGTVTISNCCNSANIEGSNYVGGICAYAKADAVAAAITISNCSNSANIEGSNNVGGICAYAYAYGTVTISNCCNSATVTSTSTSNDVYVGGICAYAYADAPGTVTISNCCNSATVTSTSTSNDVYVGGICAYTITYGTLTISNCYYETNKGVTKGIGNQEDAAGKTTALPADQMKAAAGETSGNGWKEITVKDTRGNEIDGFKSTKVALVDALNAWVNKNTGAVEWKTASNNSIYPVLMIFPYVSFQTALNYEIQGGYHTSNSTISEPGLEKLNDDDDNLALSWSSNSITLYEDTEKTKPKLNIVTAKYTVNDELLGDEEDNQQIVEVLDKGRLYVGVFDDNDKSGEGPGAVVGIEPKGDGDGNTDNFLCWVGNVDNDSDLEVLSYRDDYYFYARSDRTIIAVYEGDDVAKSINELKEAKAETTAACANIESVDKVEYKGRKGFKVVSMCSAPDKYTISEAGLIATDDGSVGNNTANFKVSNGKILIKTKDFTAKNAQLTWENPFTNTTGTETWYLRAYLKCTDQNETKEAYGKILKAIFNIDNDEAPSCTSITEGGLEQ